MAREASWIGRISAAVLVLLLIVYGSVSLYFAYRASTVPVASPIPFIDQLAAIGEMLDGATPGDESRILRALNSPYLIVRRVDGQAMTRQRRFAPLAWFAQRLSDAALAKAGRTVEVDFAFISRDATERPLAAPHLPVDETVMSATLKMPDGRRFLVQSDSPFLTLGMLSRLFGNMLLMALLVVGATIYALKRLIAPISRFAEAADRFKADVDSPPLDEKAGVSEVRAAARAFNAMQARLRTLIQERTQMLAAISHDMRTLVTRWSLRAHAIQDAELRARSLADVAEINEMLGQFLDFARASSAPLSSRRVDLGSIAQSVADEFGEDGPPVECDIVSRAVVETDPAAVKRILRNLVSNALRYGVSARVVVTGGNGGAVVEVLDDGPGLPPDKLEAVFAPYVRMEDSRNRDTGGMGLGLPIVRTLAGRLGCTVGLDNRPEGGLRAAVHFPLASLR